MGDLSFTYMSRRSIHNPNIPLEHGIPQTLLKRAMYMRTDAFPKYAE